VDKEKEQARKSGRDWHHVMQEQRFAKKEEERRKRRQGHTLPSKWT
jgi:hypothetical protein